MLPDEAFITPAEYRAFRQISPSTYHRWVAAGLIPAPIKAGPAKRLHRMGDARAIDQEGTSHAA
jgi:predicted site-specific integrase-resolvase